MYKLAQIKKDKILISSIDSLDKIKLNSETTWIHINAKTERQLSELQEFFGFHKLAIEDCVDHQQRPKVDIMDEYVLIIIKALELKTNLVSNQVALFIGENYLVTVSNKALDSIEQVMKNLEIGNLKRTEPDYIAYRILDRIVDAYFPIIDGIENEIEVVEKNSTKKTNGKHVAEKVFKTRRNLLTIRKASWPARDIFSTLSKGDIAFISKRNRIYYRDVYDHVVLTIDLVETYRELVSGILETHLSAVSNSLNEVMKVLTVISTIFIPLTFITGLYGMNFKYMPELGWEYSYGAVILVMLLISLGMLYFFKKRGWL